MSIFRAMMPLLIVSTFAVFPKILPAYPPKYLKTDTAITYEVDPTWPQRPDSVAPLGAVSGVAVDADDRVWLFNRGPDPVQVYAADGKFIRTWGRDTLGKAHHLKIDKDGNIWVADIGHHVVQKYSPGGQVLLTIGTPDQPGEDDMHYNLPTDMAIGPKGDVYISDGYGNNRVVQCDSQGRFVRTWGNLGVARGEFNLPHAIACDSTGRVFVADRNNVRVQVFDPAGKFLDAWTNLIVPWGITMNKDDELWICGSSPMAWWKQGQYEIPLGCPPKDQVFMRFATDGRLRQLWTVPKALDGFERPGELNWVHALAVDSKGNLYAGDILGMRAQKFMRREP